MENNQLDQPKDLLIEGVQYRNLIKVSSEYLIDAVILRGLRVSTGKSYESIIKDIYLNDEQMHSKLRRLMYLEPDTIKKLVKQGRSIRAILLWADKNKEKAKSAKEEERQKRINTTKLNKISMFNKEKYTKVEQGEKLAMTWGITYNELMEVYKHTNDIEKAICLLVWKNKAKMLGIDTKKYLGYALKGVEPVEAIALCKLKSADGR